MIYSVLGVLMCCPKLPRLSNVTFERKISILNTKISAHVLRSQLVFVLKMKKPYDIIFPFYISANQVKSEMRILK